MPTLHWIGKEKVINHHLDIPYHTLNKEYTYDDGVQQPLGISENKIIHADNLLALKSLLPEYEGRIKCIYIDPPYNTGNESWVYNDNVSDPRFKKWLGKVVGKEAEDLTRHDKWLCMMYPRLKLLYRLLAEDGVIFISIDDNEQVNLKMLCDEIFGSNNFISSLVWRRRASSQMALNNISVDHEYIVSYFKHTDSKFIGIKKDYKNYSNPDNDIRGEWTLGDLTVGMTKDQRPNQFYDLVDPDTCKIYKASAKRVWTFIPETMEEKINEKRVVFPKTEKGRPMMKRFLSELKSDINPLSSWLNSDSYSIGLNSEGTKVIQNIFGEKIFDYPKPISLIEIILSQTLNFDDIVLDSFSGSGTTAHAVLNLNKRDGGKRKFILIEMEDYAETITAERVKRVIKGYGETEGTGGNFNFYTLGERVLDDEQNLNPNLSVEKIHSYVWYSETHQPYTQQANTAGYLGKYSNTGYYFFYQPNEVTTLDDAYLTNVTELCEQYVMYADVCLLSERTMLQHNIIFKKIPRDISKL